jgi:hypothetical protein
MSAAFVGAVMVGKARVMAKILVVMARPPSVYI